MKSYLGISVFLFLAACSQSSNQSETTPSPASPQPNVQADNAVVRGLAVVEVRTSDVALEAMDTAASTSVVYVNAPSVTFEIDPSNLVAGNMTGDTLSLGNVKVTALKDNKLDLCGTSGNQKCTTAEIRVYTTGTVAGFVNTSETPNYGVPVFASGLNPTIALTLGKPGVAVQQLTNIPATKHNLKLSDFPNPTYNVTSDFRDAGSGTYKMTFVIEYALKP
jgi:hypothetical protein